MDLIGMFHILLNKYNILFYLFNFYKRIYPFYNLLLSEYKKESNPNSIEKYYSALIVARTPLDFRKRKRRTFVSFQFLVKNFLEYS